MSEKVKWEELSPLHLETIIANRKNLVICGIPWGCQSDAAKFVEAKIEEAGLTCRVYTAKRASALLLSPLSIAVAVHNLATYDPDYEICKDAIDTGLTITYKKG